LPCRRAGGPSSRVGSLGASGSRCAFSAPTGVGRSCIREIRCDWCQQIARDDQVWTRLGDFELFGR
jgi:hypothetical protein